MNIQPIIDIHNLTNCFENQCVHNDLSLKLFPKEIVAIIGGSGSGKTTLLQSILGLLSPTAGSVRVFDQDIYTCSEAQATAVRRRWGVLFQQNALFSSLTVLENVQFPLRTFTNLPKAIQQKIALIKIAMSGLSPMEVANQYPSELSGGMQKRAGLARAIALDPELLFLDEPTAGLDPKSAEAFDELILKLRDSLGLTVVMVTHDMESLRRITDKVAFLGEGKVLAIEPLKALVKNPHPLIHNYFSQ